MTQNKGAAGLKTVLVCGSDGVGSTAAMMASVLAASGRRCGLLGLYRAEINGVPLKPEEGAGAEAALRAFAAEKCAFAVVECRGPGEAAARLTEAPECLIITRTRDAELDGCLARIPEGGCVCAYMPESDAQLSALAAACRRRGAALRLSDPDELETLRDAPDGQTLCYCDDTPYDLALAGDVQARNAAAVLEAVEMLRERGVRIRDAAVAEGLAAARAPCCFEAMPCGTGFILDTPRTLSQAEAMRGNFDYYFAEARRAALVSATEGPDTDAMLGLAVSGCRAAVCVTGPEKNAVPAPELARRAGLLGCPALICDTPDEAVSAATAAAGEGGAVCCMVTPETGRAIRAIFIREDT